MKRCGIILLLVLAFIFSIYAGGKMAVGQPKRDPIRIGLVAEKTGGLAAYGYSHERVMVAAVAKVNKEGGIAGRPVELYVEDSESKPSVGALKFRKAGGNEWLGFHL